MDATVPNSAFANRTVQTRALIASSAAFCIANITWWMQPELLSQLVDGQHLTDSQAGLVVSVELGALALSSVLLSRFLRGIPLLVIASLGAFVAIVATVLSIEITRYAELLAARTMVGVAEGAIFMVANMSAARFSSPDRTYAQMNFVNVLVGVTLVAVTPYFRGTLGQTSALPALLTCLICLTPLILCLPYSLRAELAPAAGVGEDSPRRRGYVIALLITSFLLFSLLSVAMWAFYGLIGTQDGLTESEVSHAIAVAASGAFAGSALAALLGTSFGRVLPITLGALSLGGAIMVLCFVRHPVAFRVATIVNVATMYLVLSYYFGAAAEEDPSGRALALVGGTYLAVGAVGPYLGGILIQTIGLRALGYISLCTSLASWIAFVLVEVALKRRAAAPVFPMVRG